MQTAQTTLVDFLEAFARLDLDGLLEFFDSQANAFLPVQHKSVRLQGSEALRQAFSRIIEATRAAGRTSIALDPQELIVEEWGDVAIATFHLRDGQFCRRTFVLRRTDRWRIVHLHASNGPREAGPGE